MIFQNCSQSHIKSVSSASGIPPCPEPIEDEENGGVVYFVPDNIRPVMAPHRIECLFWGVREMKSISFKKVNKPRVEMDCMGVMVASEPLESAKVCIPVN